MEDGDCSYVIKTLAPWKKSYHKRIVLKSRDITLLTKYSQSIVKATFLPVVIYECKSWRFNAFKPWCWRRDGVDCMEIKPVNRKGNQSWIFFKRTDAEAEALVLWLPDAKCWLIGKDWCWESLKAEEEGNDRGQNGWMASLTQWTWVWASSRRWWDREAWRDAVHGVAELDMTEQLNN